MSRHQRVPSVRLARALHCAVLAAMFIAIASCTSTQRGARDTIDWGQGLGPGEVTPVEVQSRIMSFADNYIGLFGGAVDRVQLTMESPKEIAVLTQAAAGSIQNVVTIASSGNPVVGYLDMRVLVSLQKRVIDERMIPEPGGERLEPLSVALGKLDADLRSFGERLLTPSASEQLDDLVDVIFERDGGAARLDWLRASELADGRQQLFIRVAGGGNLLSLFHLDPLAKLNPAAREVAQSRLLAERSVFYGMRLPSIARWQAEALTTQIAAMQETQTVVATIEQIGTAVDGSEEVLASATSSLERVSGAIDRTAETVASFEGSINETLSAAIDRSMNGIAIERDAAFAQLTAERTAAVDQIFDGVEREREALLSALREENEPLRTTLGEVRQTVEATERLSDSLERSSDSVRKLVAAMPASAEPDPNAPTVADYRELLETTGRTASELRGLLETVEPMLAPDALDASTERFAEVGRWGESLVDRAFQRAVTLVIITAVAALVVGIALRFVWKR